MAQEYEEVRHQVAERSAEVFKMVRALDSSDSLFGVENLDEAESFCGQELSGSNIDDELIVQVFPLA